MNTQPAYPAPSRPQVDLPRVRQAPGHALAHIAFRGRADGSTGLSDLYQAAPLRVLRPRPLEAQVAEAVVANVGGGLVGGDRSLLALDARERHLRLEAALHFTDTPNAPGHERFSLHRPRESRPCLHREHPADLLRNGYLHLGGNCRNGGSS